MSFTPVTLTTFALLDGAAQSIAEETKRLEQKRESVSQGISATLIGICEALEGAELVPFFEQLLKQGLPKSSAGVYKLGVVLAPLLHKYTYLQVTLGGGDGVQPGYFKRLSLDLAAANEEKLRRTAELIYLLLPHQEDPAVHISTPAHYPPHYHALRLRPAGTSFWELWDVRSESVRATRSLLLDTLDVATTMVAEERRTFYHALTATS